MIQPRVFIMCTEAGRAHKPGYFMPIVPTVGDMTDDVHRANCMITKIQKWHSGEFEVLVDMHVHDVIKMAQARKIAYAAQKASESPVVVAPPDKAISVLKKEIVAEPKAQDVGEAVKPQAAEPSGPVAKRAFDVDEDLDSEIPF